MTLAELLDVAAHMDRQRFPDRWKRVQDAIASRRTRTEFDHFESAQVPAAPDVGSQQRVTERAMPARRGMTRKQAIIFVSIVCVLALTSAAWTAVALFRTHFWRGPDAQFGDQHLKTAVALIELHRIRFGKYPERLSDLQFTGDWDQIALNSVSYHANAAGTRYCVQVERGWVAKPKLNMPPEFWLGTGYDPTLCR